ncbi:hypothetical protein V3C99_004759, partial [Haemonchus contortus]
QLAIRPVNHAQEKDRREGGSNQARRSRSIPKKSQIVHRPTFKRREDGNSSGTVMCATRRPRWRNRGP